jgi:hypothetical protein
MMFSQGYFAYSGIEGGAVSIKVPAIIYIFAFLLEPIYVIKQFVLVARVENLFANVPICFHESLQMIMPRIQKEFTVMIDLCKTSNHTIHCEHVSTTFVLHVVFPCTRCLNKEAIVILSERCSSVP